LSLPKTAQVLCPRLQLQLELLLKITAINLMTRAIGLQVLDNLLDAVLESVLEPSFRS
jgi:hypothetical protein